MAAIWDCKLQTVIKSHSSAGYPPVPSGTFGRGALALFGNMTSAIGLGVNATKIQSLIAQLVRALH